MIGMWWDTSRRDRSDESSQITEERPIPGTDRLPQRGNRYGLSAREIEVVGLVAAGLTDKGIAMTLRIRPKTVGKHLEHIRAKMNCSSRTEVGVVAVKQGLVR